MIGVWFHISLCGLDALFVVTTTFLFPSTIQLKMDNAVTKPGDGLRDYRWEQH